MGKKKKLQIPAQVDTKRYLKIIAIEKGKGDSLSFKSEKKYPIPQSINNPLDPKILSILKKYQAKKLKGSIPSSVVQYQLIDIETISDDRSLWGHASATTSTEQTVGPVVYTAPALKVVSVEGLLGGRKWLQELKEKNLSERDLQFALIKAGISARYYQALRCGQTQFLEELPPNQEILVTEQREFVPLTEQVLYRPTLLAPAPVGV